jgi:hypothetical protein
MKPSGFTPREMTTETIVDLHVFYNLPSPAPSLGREGEAGVLDGGGELSKRMRIFKSSQMAFGDVFFILFSLGHRGVVVFEYLRDLLDGDKRF